MKPHLYLTRLSWLLTIFFCAPTMLLVMTYAADAAAQTPAPTPALPVLTTSTVVALVLPLVLGVVNQAVQSGKLFGQWQLAVSMLPGLTIFGSFLAGAIGYLQTVGWAISAATIVYAIGAGVGALVIASAPGVALRHLGVELKRGNGAPPPSTTNAVTQPPKAAS